MQYALISYRILAKLNKFSLNVSWYTTCLIITTYACSLGSNGLNVRGLG